MTAIIENLSPEAIVKLAELKEGLEESSSTKREYDPEAKRSLVRQ